MASSLNKEKTIDEMIDEDLAKYHAMTDRDQARIVELEERNTHLADAVRSNLVVPAAAFGAGYVRGRYGEKTSVLGISIDAAASLVFGGLGTLLGFLSNKGAQTAAKICGDIAHGTLACWTSATGAELGLKKRMEMPAPSPAPQPVTGVAEMAPRSSRALTHEELAAIKADTLQRAPSPLTHEELAAFAEFKAKLAMQERPPVPAQAAPPWQSPTPPAPKTNPLPKAEAVAPKPPARSTVAQSPAPPAPRPNPLPKPEAVAPKATAQSPAPQQPRCNTQQCPGANAESAPKARSTREKPLRFTQRGQVDGESGLTALLRSFGIPPISETPNWPNWPCSETSIENLDRILRWARAPA